MERNLIYFCSFNICATLALVLVTGNGRIEKIRMIAQLYFKYKIVAVEKYTSKKLEVTSPYIEREYGSYKDKRRRRRKRKRRRRKRRRKRRKRRRRKGLNTHTLAF
jgi:hypothetical protein